MQIKSKFSIVVWRKFLPDKIADSQKCCFIRASDGDLVHRLNIAG